MSIVDTGEGGAFVPVNFCYWCTAPILKQKQKDCKICADCKVFWWPPFQNPQKFLHPFIEKPNDTLDVETVILSLP